MAMFPPELATKPLQCAFWRDRAKPMIKYPMPMRGKGPAGIMSAYPAAWVSPPEGKRTSLRDYECLARVRDEKLYLGECTKKNGQDWDGIRHSAKMRELTFPKPNLSVNHTFAIAPMRKPCHS